MNPAHRKEFSRRAARGEDNRHVVNKRLRIVLLILAVALLAVAAWFTFHSTEPVYQGKKLSEWLEYFRDNDVLDESPADRKKAATEAIQQMGTNSIPYLLRILLAEDSAIKQKVAKWFHQLGEDILQADDRRESALAGFFALGEVAEPAIPTLAKAITNKNHTIQICAIEALLNIGTTNCAAVFIGTLTNANRDIRLSATMQLGFMRDRAQAAIPALLNLANDSDAILRRLAIRALGNIALKPDSVVPVLRVKLADPDPQVRAVAARSLGAFGTSASTATEALRTASADSDKRVREAATRSLFRVQLEMRHGGIVRGPRAEPRIAFVFTAHEWAEGAETILNELARHHTRASFFLTGDFLANQTFALVVQRMLKESHYVGPHSDKHLLYCAWDDSRALKVKRDEFYSDLDANILKIRRLGVTYNQIGYFLPPYEHYNRRIADWTKTMDITLINFTPGTRSNADYTGEADKNFVSSQAIFDSILKKEREDPRGLNGFILLLHLGSGPGRKDKFHHRFGELLDVLVAKGYQFVRLDELLELKPDETPKADSPPDRSEAREGERP